MRRGDGFVNALTMAKLYDGRETAPTTLEASQRIGPMRQPQLDPSRREALRPH